MDDDEADRLQTEWYVLRHELRTYKLRRKRHRVTGGCDWTDEDRTIAGALQQRLDEIQLILTEDVTPLWH